MRGRLFVGVDTGGTFTDVVASRAGRVEATKVLSTPRAPARAVLEGLARLLGEEKPEVLGYGTTVATNSILERRGARVLLFTTAGCEDVVEIGRQERPDLYALEPRRPPPLVPRRWRCGIRERVDAEGRVLESLSAGSVAEARRVVRRGGPDSVAICFLHSYRNPAHEKKLARALRRDGVFCSVSHELSPLPREFERFSTTVANAYVAPRMSSHLEELARALGGTVLRVMQSNGGAVGAAVASREAVRTVLSGPAAGVVGALAVGRRFGRSRILTFDMGGTSTDVSLVDGEPSRRTETEVGGVVLLVPALDVHTVGAGGGSIAFCDSGGMLRVGPKSAGADPGPACYGKGDLPTVTDANLLLGRLGHGLLAGGLELHPDRAHRAVARLARALGVSWEEAAEGIVEVANVTMARALRRVSVERGYDPREYTLVAFGGAAGLHACALAELLSVEQVLVPPEPGVLSAWGALVADVVREWTRTVRKVEPSWAELGRVREKLSAEAFAALRHEGKGVVFRSVIHARYLGQSYEIEVPFRRSYVTLFHRAHEKLYGYADPARPVEVVALSLVAIVPGRRCGFPPVRGVPLRRSWTRLRARGRWWKAPVLSRDDLEGRISGPAVLAEEGSTLFLPPGWRARVLDGGALELVRER
ncbi:MAG: N-methylhydantoinase A [Candidatus Binatia bacterium]|nr:MAG: N-methylhydantoinase A [Candidatus Binatia bacterium]